jgi:hypothetical protein
LDTFEITIQRESEEGWPVVVEWSDSKTSLPVRTVGLFQFDQTALNSQVTSRDYGTILGQSLFRDDVRDAFIRARTESDEHLCVLLFVEDVHLRTLRWERLCAPLDSSWDFLSLNQRTPFSLYLPSATERRFRPFGRRDLRALLVVASPEGLERFRLAPFDVAAAVTSVQTALGTIPCDVLATMKETVGPPTLDAICDHITTTPYTLLHIVCHGRYYAENGETVLYLAGANQQAEPIGATQLVERFKRIGGTRGLPHFAFLATCESASPQAEGALGGLAQRLVRDLGMPAVLAMTEQVSLSTAQALSQGFYRQLRTHGQVDLALVEACAGLLGRADITVPALYSRLGARPLFTDALDRELNADDLRLGFSRLKDLFLERAPILWEPLQKPLKTVQESIGKTASLSETGRSERKRALEEINLQCLEALDISFHALAVGEDPPPYDSRCPFRGLTAFGPEHQEFFFGRERLIARLQQRLNHHPFLAVVGSSGCGKSSLVLAGVVPALQRAEPGLQFIAMTPGKEPLEQLQGNLAHVEASRPCLLVVDQFEEIFTLCSSEQKRQAFLKELLTLVSKHQVIITMRADFIVECAPYQAFKTLMQEHLELVAPMDPAELRRAMELQVAAVGLRFDADLSSRILDDVEREPAAMPLLQHALLELWKRRHGHWLRAEEYRAIGGIQQAIARTADTVYEGLEPAEQKHTREIFVRLTKPDVDALPGEERRDTLQRVWLDELVPAGGDLEATKRLVKRLGDARLVVVSVNSVTDREEVEVAHEALIRHWPRLRTWLNEERDSLRLRQRIREAAREWEQHGRPRDRLYRGAQLKEARAWAARNMPSSHEIAFLRASAAYRMRFFVNVTVVFLLIVLSTGIAGWYYLHQPPDSRHVINLQDDGTGSLRWAIANAPSGSTITFDPRLRGTIVLTTDLLISRKSLSIRGPGAHLLAISSTHQIDVRPGVSISFFGLTFTGSTSNSTSLLSNEGMLTLIDSTVSGNTTSSASGGGGIGNFRNSTLTLINSSVSGNTASSGGGGIVNWGTLTLTNSTVSGNTSPNGLGGGIFNSDFARLTLTNSTVSGNTTNYAAGGIFNDGTVTLTNSTVSGNTASIRGGGGIFNDSGGKVMLTNSTVSGNTASSGSGGGIFNNDGTVTLTNSTVSGNTSTNDGGGIFNGVTNTLTLINSTISSNSASGPSSSGGGIAILGSQAIITFCTIYGNKATSNGGGLSIKDSQDVHGKNPSQVSISNSIIAGDHAGTGPDISGKLTSHGYNLIQDTFGATFTPNEQHLTDIPGKTFTDLKIDPVLRDNGGLTKPHTFTHMLLPGSPALGRIPPDACHINDITSDQRGVKRPEGNEQFCDIGAYELTE